MFKVVKSVFFKIVQSVLGVAKIAIRLSFFRPVYRVVNFATSAKVACCELGLRTSVLYKKITYNAVDDVYILISRISN